MIIYCSNSLYDITFIVLEIHSIYGIKYLLLGDLQSIQIKYLNYGNKDTDLFYFIDVQKVIVIF